MFISCTRLAQSLPKDFFFSYPFKISLSIIYLLFVMLVDPRPYTYEYRKPRYSNPTLYLLLNLANPKTYTTVFTTVDPPLKSMTSSPITINTLSIAISHKLRITAPILNVCQKMNGIPNGMMQDSSCHLWAKTREQERHPTLEAWILHTVVQNYSPNEERVLKDSESTNGNSSHTTLSAATPKKKAITSFAASPNWP